MKKFFIYTICLFSLFLFNDVKAYTITMPTESQYRDILNQVGGYRNFGQACFYNNYPNEHVICYFGATNFNMWANQNDNLKSNYNIYGAYFNSWFWDQNNNQQYLSDAIATWNGTSWTINCLGNGHTCSNIDQANISSSTEYMLTWYYQSTYFSNYNFVKTPYIYDNSSQTLSSMEQYTSIFLGPKNIYSFNVAFEQGQVIIKDSGGAIANLVTYYVEPTFSDFVPDNFVFSYVENTIGGGFRDSYIFTLNYSENGISYNGNTYHYYFNIPLNYNTGVTFSIYDSDDNLIQENYVNAYLSTLTDLSGYTMYDFRNYEYANMSNINSGSFGLSNQLNSNITINAINYSTGISIDFLTSNYLVSSHTDNTGVVWYDFNFNNEPIYLQFINNFNNSTDFYTFIDTYHLYLYFDNTSYVHLSGSPNSLESQQQEVNQQAYKDSQGNIIYEENPIVIGLEDSTEFFENLKRYFDEFDTDTFGLTGIITSPLHLIQNLLSNSCSSLSLPLPYINSSISLPCMSSIYSQYFGGFLTLYQGVTFGLVAYWVTIRILNLVKDFRNPDHDEIEVLDL